MVVVILMAGRGTRTQSISPEVPKPLIKIHSIPMIDWVIANFLTIKPEKFVFVAQKEVSQKYGLHQYFKKYNVPFEIVELDGPNEGAAISALAAQSFYKNRELILTNSDQYLTVNLKSFVEKAHHQKSDGAILTMRATGPKWSYVRLNGLDEVTEVAEKKEISQTATCGIYWFKNGNNFVTAAQAMIDNNDRTNNEFYIAPVYNYLIKDSKKITIFDCQTNNNKFFGLGTSADLQAFQDLPESKTLANGIHFS